jgi:REP element-mobilizing transposase RayT
MASRRPPRLHSTLYAGFNRYLVTVCAFGRLALLVSPPCFDLIRKQLLQSAAAQRFSVLAYCVMPDHAHLLVEALAEDACLLPFVSEFKQRTGFAFKRLAGQALWQDGFHDHILRADECARSVARYLLENPVRAGLVRHPLEWPYLGSERYTLRELLESAGDTRG